MFFISSLLLVGLLAAPPVSAVPDSLGPIHQLLGRQTSGTLDPNIIPAQCRSACSVTVASANRCSGSTDRACGCSTAEERGFVDCLNCLVTLSPTEAFINQVQSYVDEYVSICKAAGVSLPATTVSGGVSAATASSPASFTAPAPGSATRTSGSGRTTLSAPPTVTGSGSGGASDDNGSDSSPLGPSTGSNNAERSSGGALATTTATVLAALAYLVFF